MSGDDGDAHASPDRLPPLGSVVRGLELTAKKSLGQHFILDLNLTRRIARAAGPLAGSTVVEVGPGPGGLTRALLLEGMRALRRRGCTHLVLGVDSQNPTGAMRLYESVGFREWRTVVAFRKLLRE